MNFAYVVMICLAIYIAISVMREIMRQKREKGNVKSRIASKKALHEKLVEYRKKAGLEPEDVADVLNVPWVLVKKWESGQEDPGTGNLLELAKLYKVSAEELLKDVRFL